MPVDYATEDLYSIQDLSQRFQVPQEDILKIVTDKNLIQHNINNGAYLNKDELKTLIDELFPSGNDSNRTYEIPEYLKNCTSPWAKTLVTMYQEKFTFPASVSPAQGEFLKTLAANIAPKTVVEIGCFTGISTVWLASGLEQSGQPGTIHSIDLFVDIIPAPPYHRVYLKNPIDYARKSIESAQLSHRVNFYKGNSLEVGQKINQTLNEPIDLLYIDGDHTIEGCYKDFVLYSPHVSVGGYIVLHDIYPEHCNWDGPRYLIDKYIKNSPNYELFEIKTSPVNYGMAVIRKLSEDTNLDWRNKMKQSAIWQSIKGKPLGNFIKKRFF